jgi:hypothetical protein
MKLVNLFKPKKDTPKEPSPYPNVMKKDGWEKALQESKRYEGVLYWGHEN